MYVDSLDIDSTALEIMVMFPSASKQIDIMW